ncbi:MAG: tetratricopeptide repeat protein [Acidobacteriota bacterium]|nr:tetratricopeptide repeat protein [Acidobacteriota bacterium]
MVAGLLPVVAVAQDNHSQGRNGVVLQGKVSSSSGAPVGDAMVRLQVQGNSRAVETKTNSRGAFWFENVVFGTYSVSARKAGLNSLGVVVVASPGENKGPIDLVLGSSGSGAGSAGSSQAMEFSDEPNFTIAGVTDWTAVGGHGSDSTLRTSEDLARETLTLKNEKAKEDAPASSAGGEEKEAEGELRAALAGAPGSFAENHRLGVFYLHHGRCREAIPLLEAAYRIDPAMDNSGYDLVLAYQGAGDLVQARDLVRRLLLRKNTADLHRIAGEIDEKMDDPLAAVREQAEAVRLDPSERNYFGWGSELLLHRAVWQAVEVFRAGAKAYPKSERTLTALGTALFAGALYDEAAVQLCAASDLNPTDADPYVFMGRVERASPAPLACVSQRLGRFVQQKPGDAMANYMYAMTLLKQQERAVDPLAQHQAEDLLAKAVALDPKCVDAYLQLGILSASQHQYEKAIGFYTKAIEVNPQSGEAHYRLGVAYDRTGAPEKAREEFLLHAEIERRQAAEVERQRKEIKQFLVVLQGQPGAAHAQ